MRRTLLLIGTLVLVASCGGGNAATTTTAAAPTTTTAAPTTTTEVTTTTFDEAAPPPPVTGLTVEATGEEGEIQITFDPSPDPFVGAYMVLFYETPDAEREVGLPVWPTDTIGDKLGYIDPMPREIVDGGSCYVVVAQKPNPVEQGILFSPETEPVCLDLSG
jgi:hypothetical protein